MGFFSFIGSLFTKNKRISLVSGNPDNAVGSSSISADQSVIIEEQDKFQRYHFSKRIADTIIDRNQGDCIVIGIYGAWGEGKTSVLNFIEANLRGEKELVIVKFNPWRYPDENALLLQFFKALARALDSKLNTGKERAGQIIAEYSNLLSLVNNVVDVAEAANKVGNFLDQKDPEVLKNRINALIQSQNKKVVIFIDDIDRLDKSEIHTVFRLVKLTADFINTTYILSFDEDMVAAAIGERFGQGDQQAGMQFLEKIIQVPLRIPLAQPEALKAYTIALINSLLDAQDVVISDSEGNRFVSGFDHGILARLNTPRLAVRYQNSLAFSLPLLKNEANMVDLMLVEGIKIFYPDHYHFIKSSPEYFVSNYASVFLDDVTDQVKVKKLRDRLGRLAESLNEAQADQIEALLKHLFPRVDAALSGAAYNEQSENAYYLDKRVCNEHYFRRYFTYAVIKGELSDVKFERLLDDVVGNFQTAIQEDYPEILKTVSANELVRKIRSREENYTWPQVTGLAHMLASKPEILQDDRFGGIGRSFSPFIQSIISVLIMIEKHKSRDDGFKLLESLLLETSSLNYALQLLGRLELHNRDEIIFDVQEIKRLKKLVLDNTLRAAQDAVLHERHPELAYRLYNIWQEVEPERLNEYFKDYFSKNEDAYIKILYALGATISAGGDRAYYSNVSSDNYQYITGLVDAELIRQQIEQVYTPSKLSEPIKWEEHSGPYQTDDNMVRQFMYWYNKNQGNSI